MIIFTRVYRCRSSINGSGHMRGTLTTLGLGYLPSVEIRWSAVEYLSWGATKRPKSARPVALCYIC